MVAARKKMVRKGSGEHPISLDEQIRRRFERAFATDLQTTSRLEPFVLDDMLAQPEVRPTHPPEPAAPESESENAVAVGSLPPPAIEINRAS